MISIIYTSTRYRDIECFYCCKKYVNQEAFRLHLKKIHHIDNIHPEEVEIENA